MSFSFVEGDDMKRCQMVLRTVCCTAFLIFCVSFASLSGISKTFASPNIDASVSKALNFLRSNQLSDGSISGFATSSWAAMAIAAAGEDPHDWKRSGGKSIVDYLITNRGSLDLDKALDVARFILAMTAADKDPRNIDGVNYVEALEGLFDGQIGEEAWVNDDFWAVLALISAGEAATSTVVHGSVEFIKAHQNADGGWGWGWRGVTPSDVDDTAAAIMALVSAGEDSSSEVIENAVQYLRDNQQPNGGFTSWGVINSNSDSWAMGAIVSVGQHPVQWPVSGTGVIEHLLSLQNEDGSFERTSDDPPGIDKAWNTAYAIVALCLNPYPVNIPPPLITLLGDFDGDDDIDSEDVTSFINAYTEYQQGVLDSYTDFDNDGDIDYNDIIAFVDTYIAYRS
jgi:iron complex transport system substrate-binding protein